MRLIPTFARLIATGLVLAVGVAIACDHWCQARPDYLLNDTQYFPRDLQPGSPFEYHVAVLGELLFSNVTSVYFIGPGNPPNADGSLGGLVAEDDDVAMVIYERFIVKEAMAADGTWNRTLHAYEKLGRIEQRLARPKLEAKKGDN